MIQHSVFVVDDDPAMRDALLLMLRAEGFRARAFSSASDFLEALPPDKSACVVTDMRMPGLNGTDLVRKVRELRGDNWPVIVITGHADVPLAVQLMKAGVVDFIEKPFDPNRLLESVRGCVMSLNSREADASTCARASATRPTARRARRRPRGWPP